MGSISGGAGSSTLGTLTKLVVPVVVPTIMFISPGLSGGFDASSNSYIPQLLFFFRLTSINTVSLVLLKTIRELHLFLQLKCRQDLALERLTWGFRAILSGVHGSELHNIYLQSFADTRNRVIDMRNAVGISNPGVDSKVSYLRGF